MTDKQKKSVGGCGGHCRCAEMESEKPETCAVPPGGVSIDIEGRCPCGKPAAECCHRDKSAVSAA